MKWHLVRLLHILGAHWWTTATTNANYWYCEWCGRMARKVQ